MTQKTRSVALGTPKHLFKVCRNPLKSNLADQKPLPRNPRSPRNPRFRQEAGLGNPASKEAPAGGVS
ncbi:hypothetical protein C6499_09555 [Candidatus Poribacteria bacterium]|nr:MAG: hypothetical protein C6499_09555 [Candidatus Poribacteria bacterium]